MVERLTKLPYDVVLTYQGEVRYGEMMWNTNIGYRNVWGYTPADARKLTKLPEFKPIAEGRFSGDAANGNVGASATSVSTLLRGLLKLQKLRGVAWDRQYTGHIAYAGTLDAISQRPQVLDDLIEAFRSLLRGNAKTQEGRGMFGGNQTVAVYGSARVGFNPDRLWEPGEEHIVP